jgi:hypothetical protein
VASNERCHLERRIKRFGNSPCGIAISLPALTSECMRPFWPYFFMSYLLHRGGEKTHIGTNALAAQETVVGTRSRATLADHRSNSLLDSACALGIAPIGGSTA